MKKSILIVAIAVLGLSANAQEETTNDGFSKGDVFISGSIGYDSQETGPFKTSTFEIAPRAGYFVSESIAVGLQIGYLSTKSENFSGDVEDFSVLALGAFGRYYFSPSKRFSLFGQLGINYLTAEDNLSGGKADGFGFALAPGISYFVSEHFALEATIGELSYFTVGPDGGESTDTFTFGLDLNDVNFGVVYKF